MTPGQRITKLRKEKDLQQKEVAEAIGMNRIILNRIELGKRPLRDDEAVALADYFHVTTDYLLKGKVSEQNHSSRGVRIPVLGRVVAGIPIEAVEEILDYEEITPELAATGEFFALKIRGHSMEPRMMEGDVVIVRKQEDVESGDVAIVLVNGNEATVKRVKKQEEGITLIATNTSVYEPHFYSNKEIKTLPVQILGKVVELRGKF
ncbi:LexA family protein [Megasphaera sp.]|jgi:repressor LexA|uniref:LexA family protein n=1 Tax=Megasphaera sp. TaxID=2023260 RepID=UPI003FEDB1A3